MKKLFSLILVLGLVFGGNSNAETIIHCKHFKDNSSIILKLDNYKKSLFIQDIGKIETSKWTQNKIIGTKNGYLDNKLFAITNISLDRISGQLEFSQYFISSKDTSFFWYSCEKGGNKF
jgi:hypothetical protein